MKQIDFGEDLSLPKATISLEGVPGTTDSLITGRDQALDEARYLFLQGELSPEDYTILLRELMITREQRLGPVSSHSRARPDASPRPTLPFTMFSLA